MTELITRKSGPMPKRPTLRSNLAPKAAKARSNLKQLKKIGAQQRKELESKRPPVADDMVTTTINIPKRVLGLLRKAAVGRAKKLGGKPSVSAIITELVERNSRDLGTD